MGNGSRGISVEGQNNTIGTVGAGNVISGNNAGVTVASDANTSIVGNVIGLNAAATAPLGNDTHGINISASTTSVVQTNAISANGTSGILLNGSASSTTISGNTIGVPTRGPRRSPMPATAS